MTVLAIWQGQIGILGGSRKLPARIDVFPEQQTGSKLSGWQQTSASDAIGRVNVLLEAYGGEPYQVNQPSPPCARAK